MMTAASMRAARALLQWTTREMAAASGVSLMTISEAENGRPLRKSTAQKIINTFAAHGVDIVATEEVTGATLNYARSKGDRDE